ncbi:gamma-type small acid-soluble spore protein [Oceanobacillus sp. CF4.6]|uniref:gamma-type small acid-soluble spore protein n=1 Tax=Oceanobacillus sp. CF4.6 TaxID=3373080 RepID=UPI003EE6D3CA
MKENNKQKNSTDAGTDIDVVKEKNEQSGLSYNEVKEYIAKTSGGHGTSVYSDTNIEEVKTKNRPSAENQ